jgi:hypothetical protein
MARAISKAVPGTALALACGVLGTLSFGFLDWYDPPAGADSAPAITFTTLQDSADQLHGAGLASFYFGGLAYPLLIALIAVAVVANAPFGPRDVLRVGGFTLGLVGVVFTYLAIRQLHNAQVSAGAAAHSVFYNATWGLWTAFAGFVLGAIGSVLAPRRVRS